jgi:hypothetical protein
MMETIPNYLRADVAEGKEQGGDQNKHDEPPSHAPGAIETRPYGSKLPV